MAYDTSNPNLTLWLRMEPTDPAITKSFKRGGGFSGTAINATHVMKRLTEAFGPVGHGWGYAVLADDVVQGGPIYTEGNPRVLLGHESVQRTRIQFWYLLDGKRGEFHQMGQTTYVGWRKPNQTRGGYFETDEEAWKKSLTDAITKAASHIGIGSDIHMGMFDDNKYVNDRQAQEIETKAANDRNSEETELARAIETLVLALDDASDEVTVTRLRTQAAGLRPRLQNAGEMANPLARKLSGAIAAACERNGLPVPGARAPATTASELRQGTTHHREPGDESEPGGAMPVDDGPQATGRARRGRG